MAHVFGVEGVLSSKESEAVAAYRSIECLMQSHAALIAPFVVPRIEQMLDRQEAEALSPADLRIFETPEGRLRQSLRIIGFWT